MDGTQTRSPITRGIAPEVRGTCASSPSIPSDRVPVPAEAEPTNGAPPPDDENGHKLPIHPELDGSSPGGVSNSPREKGVDGSTTSDSASSTNEAVVGMRGEYIITLEPSEKTDALSSSSSSTSFVPGKALFPFNRLGDAILSKTLQTLTLLSLLSSPSSSRSSPMMTGLDNIAMRWASSDGIATGVVRGVALGKRMGNG